MVVQVLRLNVDTLERPGKSKLAEKRGNNVKHRRFRLARNVAIAILAVAVACGALASSSQSHAAAVSAAAPRTVLVFDDRVRSDASVADELSRNGVRASAVFTWSFGITSTHRTYVDRAPDALMAETRNALFDSYTKGLESNLFRLERFVAAHTQAELASSDALQTQARSLLDIRAQLQAARAALRRGDAIVYAVEVTGEAADRVAAASQAVNARIVSSGDSSREASLRPASLPATWSDPAVTSIAGLDLYPQIVAILRASGRSVAK